MPNRSHNGAARPLQGEGAPAFRVGSTLISFSAAIAFAITAGITAAGAKSTTGATGGLAVLDAVSRGIIVALPIAVALYAWGRPGSARFGRSFAVVSGLWFVASLSTSDSPFLFSVGRMAGWITEAGLVYVLLAFPEGRLRAQIDRALVAIAVAVTATLYLPSVLFVHSLPAPAPPTNCVASCPHNALMAVGSHAALFTGVLNPVRETVTALVFLTVSIRLAARIRDADRLTRGMLVPVLGVAIARLAAYLLLFVTRRVGPQPAFALVSAWLVALAMPALALAFVVGLARQHLFVARGIRRVYTRLREMPGPEQVQDLLASAFDDPAIEIASWSRRRRHWIDVHGDVLRVPAKDSGRYLTAVRDRDQPLVAVVHDAALQDDPEFTDAAASAAAVAFERDRVAARTTVMVRQLRESRARMVAAADDERRRIERDLHDGAQQHLVVLVIHLELAAERAEHDHPEEADELRELAAEVERALEEMRSLTHDIYPAILLDRGLADAVRSAALRSPVLATFEVHRLGEYPEEIATAVYFCCVEALQNVAKHAREAQTVRIVMREANSVLSFSVCDDGPGMIDTRARVGAGLINMDDRIKTVGGRLTVRSRPGEGTCVKGRIPLSALARTSGGSDAQHRSRRTRAPRQRRRSEP